MVTRSNWSKTTGDLARRAVAQGWTVEPTANGHPRFISPSGEVTTGAGTASEYRGEANLKSRLRRLGLEDPPRRKRKRTLPPVPHIAKFERRAERVLDAKEMTATIFALLADGPLTEGMLVHALRQEGVRVVRDDLRAPLELMERRRRLERVGESWGRRRKSEPTLFTTISPPLPKPRPPGRKRRVRIKGTKGDVTCVLRKGIWHCTEHNRIVVQGEFRTLCGYTIRQALPVQFNEQLPNCPYCTEKLRRTEFL